MMFHGREIHGREIHGREIHGREIHGREIHGREIQEKDDVSNRRASLIETLSNICHIHDHQVHQLNLNQVIFIRIFMEPDTGSCTA